MKLSKRMADAYGANSSVSANKKNEKSESAVSPKVNISEERTSPVRGKIERVSRYLFLLSPKESTSVLQHMPKDQADLIRIEMLNIKSVSPEEKKELVAEFSRISEATTAAPQEKTSEPPTQPAFVRSSTVLSTPIIENNGVPFSFLKDIEKSALLALCERESAQSIAVMVSFLEPQKSANVIMSLPTEIKQQVVRRLAAKKNLKKELVDSVETVFRDKISGAGSFLDGAAFNGAKAIAKIFKYMPGEDRARLMGELESEDIGLVTRIKENLFSVDDLVDLDNRGLQIFLEGWNDNDLVYILRDKPSQFVDKIRKNLSSRRLVLLDEESDFVGPVRRSEVRERTAFFIDALRKEVDSGKVFIFRDDGENEFV